MHFLEEIIRCRDGGYRLGRVSSMVFIFDRREIWENMLGLLDYCIYGIVVSLYRLGGCNKDSIWVI
jgi:hypothetical protein